MFKLVVFLTKLEMYFDVLNCHLLSSACAKSISYIIRNFYEVQFHV